MPRCAWCNKFARDLQEVSNGRSQLQLCPLCAAELAIRERGELRVTDLAPRPGFWERLRGFFRA